MKNYFLFFSLILFINSIAPDIYIVRHAESSKWKWCNDGKRPPLTEPGKEREEALKKVLKTKKIGYIFSINTVRTRSTADPLRAYFNLVAQSYPVPDSAFINRLVSLKKNTLIVGHNTVDDIVNKLCGQIIIPADLKDTEHDNLFVVKKKKRKMNFVRKDSNGENRKYGKSSP